jgi:hypothetical protein
MQVRAPANIDFFKDIVSQIVNFQLLDKNVIVLFLQGNAEHSALFDQSASNE